MSFREIKELREQSEKARDEIIELDEKLEKTEEARDTIREMLREGDLDPEVYKNLLDLLKRYEDEHKRIQDERKHLLQECIQISDELREKREAYEDVQDKAFYAQSKLLGLDEDISEISNIIDYTDDQLSDIDDVVEILDGVVSDTDADMHKKKHLFR